MTKKALIFPGQGVQKNGMGKDLYENSMAAKKVFEIASEILGYNVADMCFYGSDEDLMKTIYSQPCIVTVEIAMLEALKECIHLNFDACAGHSLGEYSALYAAGAFDLQTVLKLIQKRAELMSEAANLTNGTMAAIIGLEPKIVIDIVNKLDNVYVANFNSPSQVVITGIKENIESSLIEFKNAGAKKVVQLSVSGAFHSPLMKNAGDEFMKFVNQFEFRNTMVPVYTNVDAKEETIGAVLQNKLSEQIYSSVYWMQTIDDMVDKGIMNYLEIGPGKVLSGLNKKINGDIKTINITDWESLISYVNEVKEKEFV